MAKNHCTDLFHLVWFGLGFSWLKIENLFNALFRKDVMTASDTFIKTQVPEQPTQIFERNVGIRGASQNLKQRLFMPGHIATLTYWALTTPRPQPFESLSAAGEH